MNVISRFFKLEATSGVMLLILALLALILCNSPWADFYENFRQIHIAIRIGHYSLSEPLLFWVNEGLMTLFFLSVGLELKYEFLLGELKLLKHAALPAVAALGGMIIPAIVYSLANMHQAEAMRGWAIPIVTDIAFATSLLSLFGKRVPLGLKVFLMALAIFDDVGAILIIAIFHTASLSYVSLALAGCFSLLLIFFNAIGIRKLSPYFIVGIMLWLCVWKSGVHSTVAGVFIGLMIPVQHVDGEAVSPYTHLRNILQPWVAFFVMPIFAFVNAGISFQGVTTAVFFSPIVLGIALGLFLGKQLGAFLFSALMIRIGWAQLPSRTSWLALYGVTVICGIGFTMSLFLGTLAFADSSPLLLTEARLGVLSGSLLSGIVGAILLSVAFQQQANELGGRGESE